MLTISHSHNLHQRLARVLILTLLLTPLGVFGKPVSPKRLSATRPPVAPVETSVVVRNVLPAAPTDPPTYMIAPSSGTQGKEYEVVVSQDGCAEVVGAAKLDLYAPAGSGITVSDLRQSQCQVTAKLKIAPDAPLGVMKLWLVKPSTQSQSKIPTVDFSITGVTPQPIPPGLNNEGQVDVMWSVVPDKITNHNFGRGVSKHFYCIEVVIGNDSGYDLQLSSVGFTFPALGPQYRVPNSGYRTVRGSLEAFGEIAPRKLIVGGLKMLGPILSGFLPFFHNLNHTANFSTGINLISNPIEKGVENVWPDLLPTQLDRLADQTYRDDVSTKTIIPNNVQARILTFIPKRLVCPNGKTCASVDPSKTLDAKNVMHVMQALGEIVIVGQQITHVNRVRVVNNPFGSSTTDHSISGKITDVCNDGVADVIVTLTGSGDFSPREVKTAADGTYSFANVPDGRTYTVTPKSGNLKLLPTTSDAFLLNDTKANADFRADYQVITITGAVRDGEDKPLEKVEIKLSGTKSGSVKTEKDGTYKLLVPAADLNPLTADIKLTPSLKDYAFVPLSDNWSCNKRMLSFVGTKNNPQ